MGVNLMDDNSGIMKNHVMSAEEQEKKFNTLSHNKQRMGKEFGVGVHTSSDSPAFKYKGKQNSKYLSKKDNSFDIERYHVNYKPKSPQGIRAEAEEVKAVARLKNRISKLNKISEIEDMEKSTFIEGLKSEIMFVRGSTPEELYEHIVNYVKSYLDDSIKLGKVRSDKPNLFKHKIFTKSRAIQFQLYCGIFTLRYEDLSPKWNVCSYGIRSFGYSFGRNDIDEVIVASRKYDTGLYLK